MNNHLTSLFQTFLLCFLYGCGGDSGTTSVVVINNSEIASSIFQSNSDLRVNIYYETGAAPFTGDLPGGSPAWSLACDNVQHLFQYRSTSPTFTCPKALNEMEEIGNNNRSVWTSDDLINLNSDNKKTAINNTVDINIYFVNGNYESGNSVLGISVGGTTIIGIFKSVIKNSGNSIVQMFVEQSIIIHEIGHAFGLVNNGIPMETNHQDVPNGNHTTDSNCVMYYLNEGPSDLAAFIQGFVNNNDNIMWGPNVLKDIESFSK